MESIALFWHRRDLRFSDNAGLYKALKSGSKVQPIFIFDTTILNRLPKNDQRVIFIHQAIQELKNQYAKFGSDLLVRVGDPVEVIPQLVMELKATSVFTNRDYEPDAIGRDSAVASKLKQLNCDFIGAKDHVIFEKNEVLKNDGKPYTVYTPYSRKWKELLTDFYTKSYPVENYVATLRSTTTDNIERLLSLQEIGFSDLQTQDFPSPSVADELLKQYHETRDIPSVNGTSRLSLHLRFGTISIRSLVRQALKSNATFLNELIWRDFYQCVLFHFPHSARSSFKPQYDAIEWEFNETQFQAWCEGKTGYPLVDAGMRELNTTGFMHNRVRMVVASFLTKHLLHDWRLGERYFAEKLLDFDLAANVGGWQWAAGSGCDAAPYFRVFNPTSQQEKFDPKFEYIKKWVPEYGTSTYPEPIVEHRFARERCLERYKKALNDK